MNTGTIWNAYPQDRFNAGVMLLKPDKAVSEDMISKVGSHLSLCVSPPNPDVAFPSFFFI